MADLRMHDGDYFILRNGNNTFKLYHEEITRKYPVTVINGERCRRIPYDPSCVVAAKIGGDYYTMKAAWALAKVQ